MAESKRGYFIDIVNGKVETAEEHDATLLMGFCKWYCKKYGYTPIEFFVAEYFREINNDKGESN